MLFGKDVPIDDIAKIANAARKMSMNDTIMQSSSDSARDPQGGHARGLT
jgi:hypothetical protein